MTKVSSTSPSTTTQAREPKKAQSRAQEAPSARAPATVNDVAATRTKAGGADTQAKQRAGMQKAGAELSVLQGGVKRALQDLGEGVQKAARADGTATSNDKPQADLAQATQDFQRLSKSTSTGIEALGQATKDKARKQ
jgi:hypothetical protein